MTTVRRRGLQLDDPLGAGSRPGRRVGGEAGAPHRLERARMGESRRAVDHGARGSGAERRRADSEPRPSRRGQNAARGSRLSSGDVWRAWSGITGVGSFRLPHELLVELGDTARELELPIGMIVTAAITQLLDQPPELVAALVDRADDARIQGRRTARRRFTERAER